MKGYHLVGPMPYCTNCYMLISDAGHAVVIDPAAPANQIEAVLEDNKAQLTHILLTHGHFDHTYSLEEVQKAHPEAKLYMFEVDAEGSQMCPPTGCDVPLHDEDVITVDEMEFKVWHTPGHTRGSCVFLCEDMLFTGDTLFHMSIGRTDFPGGSARDMMRSLEKLAALPVADEVQVLPGHESFSTLGYERAHNPYMV